MHIADSFPTL